MPILDYFYGIVNNNRIHPKSVDIQCILFYFIFVCYTITIATTHV